MEIPNTWNNLEEFVKWYSDNKYPIRVPQTARVFVTDVSYSCCIFRQDHYQVEIYLGAPKFISSRHYHPFEQAVIFLGGQLRGTRGTKNYEEPYAFLGSPITKLSSNELPNKDANKIGRFLQPDTWHEIQSLEQGFIFLNCQRWYSKEQMTSAVVQYDGAPLGTKHETLIKTWQDIQKSF